MKITLTKKEIKTMKDFCLDAGSILPMGGDSSKGILDFVNNFEEEITKLYNVKMIKAKFNLKGELILDISGDYIIEFMSIYSDFLTLAIPQVVALVNTLTLFSKKYTKLTDKYLEKEESNKDTVEESVSEKEE